MDQETLVIEDTDAGAELVRGFHAFMPVEAAFWIRTVEDGRWMLCIKSKEIDEKTYDLGYGEVLRLIQEMKENKSLYINPFQVRLLRGDDPLALAALEFQRRYPGIKATRFGGKQFGAIAVEGVYIYPASLAASAS
jgi:hypothetical protein